ncbi:MAG: methylated-DNA--[protein]-cysteine S-methyltransferase [Myxococcales bacterium]|nr:methylated-DNA--[protein]-cysteine S-methyltransferase [Myxococcales bacterium]
MKNVRSAASQRNETLIRTSEFESPVGRMRLGSTEKGLCWVELPGACGRGFSGWLRAQVPDARLVEDPAANESARTQLLEYLAGERLHFELPLDLRATPFQQAVYDELLAIPYGETRSYADVARSIGKPKAVRATGTANGANPIPLIVPCHRVIASGGGLGGYGGGLPLKRKLLAMERSRVCAAGDLL